MEELKQLSKIFELDERMAGFPWMVKSDHQRLSGINLPEDAPEDIRDYFVTIKNICLYGRFAYAFYGVAWSLTFPLMELALRERFNPGKGGGKGDFRRLLQKAIKLRLLKEEGFSHIRRIRKDQEEMRALFDETDVAPFQSDEAEAYLKILEETMPNLRNSFAHPQGQAIVLPQETLFAIGFAAEFINQLYAGGAGAIP